MFLKIYLSQIEFSIIDVNNKIKTEAAKVNIGDQDAVLRLNGSLSVFSKLAANHSYFSDFFSLLGSLTYSRVVFTKVDIDRDKGLIQLRGTAKNYTALAKQIVALRDNKDIKSLEIKSINFNTSGLEFEITAIADSKIFVKNNQ